MQYYSYPVIRAPFFFLTMFMSLMSFADIYSYESYNGEYGGLAAYTGERGNYGVEAGLTRWNSNTGYRLLVSLYNIHNEEKQIISNYVGYSMSAFASVGEQYRAYAGLGVYFGNNTHCHSSDYNLRKDDDNPNGIFEYNNQSSNGYCNNDEYLFAVFPEFGAVLNVGQVQISPFVRAYLDSQAIGEFEPFAGLSFSLRIK